MKTVKVKTLLSAVLMLATALGAGASVTASDISPQELVRDTSSRMLGALREEQDTISGNPDRLYELVADIVLPYFDFMRMSQWVLGKNWRAATEEQRRRFVEEFRRLLVRTYGNALLGYANEKIVYLPHANDEDARRVTVRTEIEQGGSNIPISYSMYNPGDGWKVYDVAVNGISLVTNYRSTFGNIIRNEGMDSLIEQLAEKNKTPSNG
ncbi:MAG: ABC transporter substrate-binding protein [Thiohalobacterales bacterium]|nr:ABC transporter substrate-binding protein [Thiohalobacterales bacterium]